MSEQMILEKFDDYLSAQGAAALVVREKLVPVEGADGVLFPATYAAGDGFPGGYNIDSYPDGTNIALIDSVGSQANRIEPLFAEGEYAKLVPQITVRAGEKTINLLFAGHRAGDAIVRCSSLQESLQTAFKALLRGDATLLAKIAPTSLVFGVWDSRDTQAKAPRLIASAIRAYDVRKLTRSAQYTPATEYVAEGLLQEPTDKASKDAYSERGFVHVPATGSHGGVIAKEVRRDATLALAALRLLAAGDDAAATLRLRRYLLGLALVAFTRLPGGYLRQGTILVSEGKREVVEVGLDGFRKPISILHTDAVAFAKAAAKEFGVGTDQSVSFDCQRAQADGVSKKKAKKEAKQP